MADYVKGHYDFPLTKKSEHKPLKGVRVIDAGNMVAAPFATVLLADFGADVIKIEHPKYGDGQRKLEPIMDGIPLWWKSVARNKRCITLDLGKPEGAEIFKRLVKGTDVIVENYRPGTFEKWGIGYDAIRAIDPRIIMLRISGFGQTGPYKNRAGFGRVAEAMSGLTNLIGEPDGPPMSPGYPLGDLIAGIFGSLSVMMALYHRDLRGGEGQMIDLALYEAVFRFLDFDPIQYDQMKIVHKRTGNRVAYVAPSSMFKTKDGKYLTLAASTQSVWLRLAEAIGRKDMTTDPKFIDNSARVENSIECNGVVGAWIEQHTPRRGHRAFRQARRRLFRRVRHGRCLPRCPVSRPRSDGARARSGLGRSDRAKRRAQILRHPRLGGLPRSQDGRRQRSDPRW